MGNSVIHSVRVQSGQRFNVISRGLGHAISLFGGDEDL